MKHQSNKPNMNLHPKHILFSPNPPMFDGFSPIMCSHYMFLEQQRILRVMLEERAILRPIHFHDPYPSWPILDTLQKTNG